MLIGHRLSTVNKADKVVYMESGKILAIGTFEEVRSKIPNFDKQAKLMEIRFRVLSFAIKDASDFF